MANFHEPLTLYVCMHLSRSLFLYFKTIIRPQLQSKCDSILLKMDQNTIYIFRAHILQHPPRSASEWNVAQGIELYYIQLYIEYWNKLTSYLILE